MKLVWWMLSGSILSALCLTAIAGIDVRLEIWLGMLGPLLCALVSWIAMQRRYTRRPEGMTALLVKAFISKMVFFAAYIIVLLSNEWVQPIPFAILFTFYYLSLHVVEAVALHRLQTAALSMSSDTLKHQLRNS